MTRVAVIGDLMLDKSTHYRTGERANPENKMIPLVSKATQHEEYRLGGAGNLAANIQAMLGDVLLCGPYHKESAERVFQTCTDMGISLIGMETQTPTIIKERVYIDNKYMYRIDTEQPIIISKDQKEYIAQALMKEKPSHIIISDYIKGTIDAELMKFVNDTAHKLGSRVLVDTKPKHMDLFGGAYLIKPNLTEFREMIGKHIANTDEDVEREGKIFVNRYQTNLVVTRSERGATLITQEGGVHHLPSHVQGRDLVDVTGAGDTFLAGITTGLMHGLPLQNAVELGNKASGIAVKQMGTSIVTAQQLRE